MKDFSYWTEYEGASEGSGRSEKLWLINPDTGQIGLFKYRKDKETTDHVSECIAYELSKLIELPCARFELGVFEGREGSMSYNIVDWKSSKVLEEGISCINHVYETYDADCLVDIKTGDKYSLEMIRRSLDSFGLYDEFLRIPVFDFLIGNTDRHQSNWALIKENKDCSISPLYDNSSSLCAYVKKEKIDLLLGKDYTLWKSLVDTKSKSIIRIHCKDVGQPTHSEVLQFLRKNNYTATKDIVEKIIENVTDRSICDILDKYDNENLSEKKKELIKKFLMSKIMMMKDIYSERKE